MNLLVIRSNSAKKNYIWLNSRFSVSFWSHTSYSMTSFRKSGTGKMIYAQEPDAIGLHSVIYICLRWQNARLIWYLLELKRPNCVSKSFPFLAGVRVKFLCEDSKINLIEHARNCELAVPSNCSTSSNNKEDFFVDHWGACISGMESQIRGEGARERKDWKKTPGPLW